MYSTCSSHRQVVVEHRLVGDERERGPGLDAARRPPVDHGTSPAVGFEEARREPEERALARAVVAHERDELARRGT